MYLLWPILSANIIIVILLNPTIAMKFPKITKFEIESSICFRLATTTVRLEVNNTENESKLFYFEVLLPNHALVFDVNLIVNNSLFVGRTINKSTDYKEWFKHAKSKVQKLLRKQTFFDINLFMMNVTLAAKSAAFFNLTYKTLLQRKDNLYTHQIPIFFRNNLFVKQLHVYVCLWEPRNITRFTGLLTKDRKTPNVLSDTSHETYPKTYWRRPNYIQVNYTKKLGKLRNVFSRVFRVQYNLKRPANSHGDILWHKGRGLYFFSDEIKLPLPMDLIFTIDTSSSMRHDWRQIVINALSTIFEKLQPTDRFNILLYNSNVHEWKRDLQDSTKENIQNAMQFIRSFPNNGVSNIDGALMSSLEHLNNSSSERYQAVYFLADGFQVPMRIKKTQIIKNVQDLNRNRNIPIFTLALGSTADVVLLQHIAATTGGQFKKIYELQIVNAVELMIAFFDEINARLLKNVTLERCDQQARRFDKSRNYYEGSEKIFYISSKCFTENEKPMIVVSGYGYEKIINYTIPIQETDLRLQCNQQRDFIESYIDFLTLRKAVYHYELKKIDAHSSLVLTYRTFIALTYKPSNQNNLLTHVDEIWTHDVRGSGSGDPHFMVTLKGLKRPVCFDMMGKPGDVINLLYDKRNDILVNAKIICGDSDDDGDGEEEKEEEENCEKTYLGIIGVSSMTENWTISQNDVQVSRQYLWQKESGQLGDQLFTAQYTDHRSMVITWKSKVKGKSVKMMIRRSQTKNTRTKYFDFYLLDGSGLSGTIGGLIGQFTHHRGVILRLKKTAGGKMKSKISLHYKNKYRTFSAILTSSRRSIQLKRECWMVWKEGKGLVNGKYQDYITHGLFKRLQSPNT